MSENTNTKIFRGEGECPIVLGINAVDGLDISKLAEKHDGAPGETTVYVFPVRSQLTWFRAKNTSGLIETEILFEDDYRAKVKATVYDENDKKLATGHGTANAQDDMRFGNKLVEVAESRSISRALDNAGYGCQLSAKTYDEITNQSPVTSGIPGEPDSEKMPTMPGEAPPISLTPDKINASKKVDANGPSQPEDISALAVGSSSDDKEAPKTKRTRKSSSNSRDAEPPVQETFTDAPKSMESSAGEQAPPAAADDSEDESQTKNPYTGPESQHNASEIPAEERKPTVPQNESSISGSSVSDPEPVSAVDRMMHEAIGKMGDMRPEDFDPAYFGNNPVDPAAFYINRRGKVTGIVNSDLQKAIRFFAQNQELIQDVVFVTANENVNGKTMRELLASGDSGKKAIYTWAYAYKGNKLSLQAATLVYYQNTPDLWRWDQREAS